MTKDIILIILCIIAGYKDLREGIIPDWITITGMVLGILLTVIYNDISIKISLLGGVIGFFLFYLICIIGEKYYNKEVIGGGDIKLAGMLGFFLGTEKLFHIIFYSSLLGIIATLFLAAVKKTKINSNIPFGFYMSAVTIFSI